MKSKKDKPTPVYEVVGENIGFAIHRNGRYLMTPAGNAYRVPAQPLADAVAQEWRDQGEKINPTKMPFTQLVATTLDLIGKDRSKTTTGLLAYIGSELLCHQVETPSSLVQKQKTLWHPFLAWCEERYDIRFTTGSGVMPITQSPEVSHRLGLVLESMDAFKLAGLSSATDAAGSLVLGLALTEGFGTADSVFEAAELDFAHQAITWGDDPVTLARQDSVKVELASCEAWFKLLG